MKTIFRQSRKSKMYIFCDDEDDNSELQSVVTAPWAAICPPQPNKPQYFPNLPSPHFHNSLQNLLSAVVQTANKICRGCHLRRAADKLIKQCKINEETRKDAAGNV